MVLLEILQVDKWNIRESLETDTLTNGNVIYERDGNSKTWGLE